MSWYEELTNPPIYKTAYDLKAPTGFKETTGTFQITKPKSTKSVNNRKQINDLKIKKGWEVALAPVKSLPMTLVMNYMTGNTLQIFSISMTLMQLVNPLTAIFNFNQPFEFLEGGDPGELEEVQYDVVIVKLAFIASQLVCLAVGIYKLNAMGLIPNSTSDWLSWETYPNFKEVNIGIF
ncbi:chaperone [Saccharomycopsis crataegensis]|uniref:ER membrane protein complex subunit 4 n=1 Tax=Saccharomycopsis crataegensis TaxID=43959 RepID=A0AAV5QL48_9ASCO|nr:chaperone [Saccharomycopsis crataegensis]